MIDEYVARAATETAVLELPDLSAESDPEPPLEPSTKAGSAAPTWERRLVFGIPLANFLVVGWILAKAGALPVDAISRVAQASAATIGRDPHPEAIGFVWPPFPTLFEVPLTLLGRWWQPILADGFAAVIVSAVLMAVMVLTLRDWMADIGVSRGVRLALVALVACNPFIVLYGANGMSEAGLLCFLCLAGRRLHLWLRDDRAIDLASCGLALAGAYLTRYEAGASVLVVTVAVGVITWRCLSGPASQRFRAVALRCLVVATPAAVAAILWSLASWVVIGEPLAQFTSRYGNEAQVAAKRSGVSEVLAGTARMSLSAQQLAVMGLVAVVAGVLAWLRGSRRVYLLAAAGVFLGPLLFQLVIGMTGETFTFARYLITVIPLGVFLAGVLAAGTTAASEPGPVELDVRSVRSAWSVRSARGVGARGLGAVGLSVVGLVVAVLVVGSAGLGTRDEALQLAELPVGPDPTVAGASAPIVERARTVAADLQRANPGTGEVLMDLSVGGAVFVNVAEPRVFVVPSDRDFDEAIANPAAFGVRYLLVADPRSGTFDAVENAYPGLFDTGAGMASLVDEWGTGRAPHVHYRLYRLRGVSR